MNRPFASAWHLPVAGLLLALLWLSVGCQGAADPKTESADAVKADSISVDKLFALFPAENLPLVIPNPNRDNSQLPPPDIRVYNAFLVGKGRLFPPSTESAYVPYLRLNRPAGSSVEVLVMLEERPDGPHYWLCTVTPQGKLIDRREVAFARIASGITHDRTATVQPDLSIEVRDVLEQRTVARDSLQLRQMGTPMVVTTTNGSYSLQVKADGSFSGTLPATAVPQADTTGRQ